MQTKHASKNCRKLVFWVFPEQLLSYIIFERLYWCEVTLVKRYNKPLQWKSEIKIFDQKAFHKNLLIVNEKKNSGVLRLNHIMLKFLTITKCLQLNCSQIQRLLVIVSLFWICPAFSHFTFHISLEVLYLNWSRLKAVNNVLTSYVKFGYIYGNFKIANQGCSPSKFSQSSNDEWRTCHRNGK